MHLKHKAVRAIVAVAGMAAALFVTQLAASTGAHAYCSAQNGERALELRVNGNLMAREVATPNTCNGNETYQGDMTNFEAGWQVVVLIQDDGQWSRFYGSSTFLATTHYQLEDNNMHTLIVLCVTQSNNWICGKNGTSVNSTGAPNTTFFEINDGF
jgi:hypothetical protein